MMIETTWMLPDHGRREPAPQQLRFTIHGEILDATRTTARVWCLVTPPLPARATERGA